MTQKITIKSLAEKMGVSITTISRALNDHPGIGKETTKAVKKIAKELGYVPNSMASNLRKNRTHIIGVITPRIDIYFHARVISGIEEIAYKSGYTVTIFQSQDSMEREIAITQTLQSRMAEGVIACLGLGTTDSRHFAKITKQGIPLVFYDRVNNEVGASKIIINDFEAAYKATKHLIDIGCKKIAHIAGPQSTPIFKSRLEGYKSALKAHSLKSTNNLIEYTSMLSYEEGTNCAEKLLKLRNRPDGVFCSNDYTATGAIQVFKRKNLHIPDDIAVAGFSNYPFSRIMEPSLTTIDDHAFEMGESAAKLVIRQIEDKDHSIASETIVIKTDLIVRESTMMTRK